MSERQFAISGRWALAADSLQWMLQRRAGQRWQSVSFVSSTRDVLVRCRREKGCPPADAERLLAALPSTFEEWAGKRVQTPATADFGRWGRPPCRYAPPQRCKRATGSRPGAGAMTPAPKLTPTEKAAKALAQLSDAEWMQVKCDEEQRRSQQRIIRDLAKRYRQLRRQRWAEC